MWYKMLAVAKPVFDLERMKVKHFDLEFSWERFPDVALQREDDLIYVVGGGAFREGASAFNEFHSADDIADGFIGSLERRGTPVSSTLLFSDSFLKEFSQDSIEAVVRDVFKENGELELLFMRKQSDDIYLTKMSAYHMDKAEFYAGTVYAHEITSSEIPMVGCQSIVTFYTEDGHLVTYITYEADDEDGVISSIKGERFIHEGYMLNNSEIPIIQCFSISTFKTHTEETDSLLKIHHEKQFDTLLEKHSVYRE